MSVQRRGTLAHCTVNSEEAVFSCLSAHLEMPQLRSTVDNAEGPRS